MKRLVLLLSIIGSFSSFAEIESLSAGARAQVFQENGVIVTVTGEAAKYMYLRGLERNGVNDTYKSDSGSYNTTTVNYGNFLCTQRTHDTFSFIPGETIEYRCSVAVRDSEY